MSRVIVNLTVSLDGYIAGPNDGPDNPLGDGGEALFDWWRAGDVALRGDERLRPPAASLPFVEEMFGVGARISGRRTFDIAGGWGGRHPLGVPFFILTHRAAIEHVGPGTEGHLVEGGIEEALAAARAVADGRDIAVNAADVAQQFIRAGLLDELQLNLVPLLLGGGVRLLENLGPRPPRLTLERVVPSDGVTHLVYDVER